MLVHCGYLRHLFGRQSEVEDVEILHHAFLVTRLGNSHDATLRKPTEGYLGSCLIIFRADSSQQVALRDAVCALSAERIPRHHLSVELIKYRLDACLLRERIALQLVHHWLQLCIVGEVEETACLEVAHTDSSHLTFTIGFLHGAPSAEDVAIGLMNEQQVDVVGLQLAQALVDALGGFFLAIVRNPDLRHEKQILAFHPTLAPRIAHAFLVLVGLCRVYQSIAHAQSICHATFTLVRANQKHAVAQGRHLNTVV